MTNLRERGHEVVAASPSSGVNAITGEGLAEAFAGASVVVDVSNSPSFEDKRSAGVLRDVQPQHSGRRNGRRRRTSRRAFGRGRGPLPDSGYFRAKVAQEKLIKASKIPYTILRATQFFEFIGSIAAFSVVGNAVHLPHTLIQPIAADRCVRGRRRRRTRGARE